MLPRSNAYLVRWERRILFICEASIPCLECVYMRVLISIFAIVVLSGCRHCNMTACLVVDKDTAVVGDTVAFNDCSDYGGDTEAATLRFGDGGKMDIISRNLTKHAYSSPGTYQVELSIGSPECGDWIVDTVVIE